MKKEFIQSIKIIILGLVLSLSIGYASAWTFTDSLPTGSDTPAPINSGSYDSNGYGQKKGVDQTPTPALLDIAGVLSTNSLFVSGDSVFSGGFLQIESLNQANNSSITTWSAPICINADKYLYLCGTSPGQKLLTVNKNGTGTGTVVSNPVGINGTPPKSSNFNFGTPVTLTATPASSVTGWNNCDTVDANVCTVTMTNDRIVTVTFSGSITLPTVTTIPASNITNTSAQSGGDVTSDGGAAVTARGIQYGPTTNPQTYPHSASGGSGNGSYVSIMSGLTPNTPYTVRAYAINSAGTGYGDPKTFTTTNTGNFTLNVYVVGTGSVTDNFGGINCGTDCSDVYIPGTIITLTATPASSFTSWGVGITGCSTNPVCTFTINANTSVVATFGTGTIVIPTVTTSPVTEITETTAKSGGTITNTGGQNANLSGIVWSLATDPVLDFNTYDGMTTDGWASGGPWVSNITGLVANTNYKVRAYARNSAGIGYGQVITFTSGGGVLTITTDPVTQITETTALGGGVVSNPGPGAYRGLAWGLNTNPVFNNNWWDLSGTGSGHFSLVMGNNQSSHNPLLLPNTHYHVRAFVSSGMNFVYGNEVTFTTAVGTPSCDSGSFIKGTSGSYNFSFDSIPGFPCTGTIAIKIFGAGGGGGGGSGGDGAMRGTSNPHPGIGTGSGGGGGGEGGAIGFLMPLTASTPNIVFSGTVGAGGSGGDGGSAGWHAGDGGNSGGETTLIGSNGTNITALGGAYGVGSGIFGFDSFAGLGGVGGSVSGVSSIVGAIEEQTFFINGANGNNGQAAWVEPHCYSNGGHGGEVNEPQTGGDGGLGGGAKQGGCVPPGEAGDGGNSGQQTYASGGGGGGGGGMGTRMWMFPGWYFVENYSAGGGGSGANGKVQITWFGN